MAIFDCLVLYYSSFGIVGLLHCLVQISVLQVWHSVGKDRQPLRKQYLEAILPPFVAILRRWRPLLAGIHELATADGLNPLTVDDRALAADALPIEVFRTFLAITILNVLKILLSLFLSEQREIVSMQCYLFLIKREKKVFPILFQKCHSLSEDLIVVLQARCLV